MKSMILAGLIFCSVSAFATETKMSNQKISEQIIAVLGSKKVQGVLTASNSSGILRQISYNEPTKMYPDQADVEIVLLSYEDTGLKKCTINVAINAQSNVIGNVGKPFCVEAK